jgi:hypothetical protein
MLLSAIGVRLRAVRCHVSLLPLLPGNQFRRNTAKISQETQLPSYRRQALVSAEMWNRGVRRDRTGTNRQCFSFSPPRSLRAVPPGSEEKQENVTPPLLAGKILLRGKPLSLRRGTGVPACRSTGGTAGRLPVERHGQDAHATARGCPSPLPLCGFAPLRYLPLLFSPPATPCTPRLRDYQKTSFGVDRPDGGTYKEIDIS